MGIFESESEERKYFGMGLRLLLEGLYTISPVKNPEGPATGSKRVVRGGGSTPNDHETVVRRRANRDPRDTSDQLGFRIVIDSQTKH